MRAGWGPGLKKACGQPAGTNMKLPGPPRNTVVPVADSQVRQSPIAVAAGLEGEQVEFAFQYVEHLFSLMVQVCPDVESGGDVSLER